MFLHQQIRLRSESNLVPAGDVDGAGSSAGKIREFGEVDPVDKTAEKDDNRYVCMFVCMYGDVQVSSTKYFML